MKTFTVYFLYNNSKNLLYIGKSISLKNRLMSHFSKALLELEPWRKEVDKENIVIYQCNNDADLDIYETYFINKYRPKYNKDKMFTTSTTFELPYIEPIKYSFDSKRPKGFQRSLLEYIELREDTENDNQELIESYESEDSLFKEVYEKLGKRGISSCKCNKKLILEKLHSIASENKSLIREMLKQEFNKGDKCLAKDVKTKLQNIYNTLNIQAIAKATDVSKYLEISILNSKGNRTVYFK